MLQCGRAALLREQFGVQMGALQCAPASSLGSLPGGFAGQVLPQAA